MANIVWVPDGGDASGLFALGLLVFTILGPVLVGLLWRVRDRRAAKRRPEFY